MSLDEFLDLTFFVHVKVVSLVLQIEPFYHRIAFWQFLNLLFTFLGLFS